MKQYTVIKQLLGQFTSQSAPLTVLDIGAMGGMDLEWKAIEDVIALIGLEPDIRAFEQLCSTSRRHYIHALAWSQSENLSLNITRSPGKSSIYFPNKELLKQFPNSERFDVIQTISVPDFQVFPLDTLLNKHEIKDVDFLKLDTQGSELDILKGSEGILGKSILGLKVEVEFIEIYKNQPLFPEIDCFLRKFGFELFDLKRTYWKRNQFSKIQGKGQLVFGDALYLKNVNVLMSYPSMTIAADARLKISKLISICVVYGLYDYALYLLEHPQVSFACGEKYIVSTKDCINEFLLSKREISFRGSKRLSRYLANMTRRLHASYLGWADSDASLGNYFIE